MDQIVVAIREENLYTICSVSYNSSQFIQLNEDLIIQLNKNKDFNWIIVENSPAMSNNSVNLSNKNIKVIQGLRDNTYNAEHWAPHSLHHAKGLNIALKYVNTRYLIVMDPDFFVVLKDWMKIITKFMTRNNISIFGAPWNPKWSYKYRYFPSPHFTVYDLKKIPLKGLNFLPGNKRFMGKKYLSFSRFYMNINRNFINSQPDTGWHIYKNYINSDEFSHFCIQPCFDSKIFWKGGNLKLNDKIVDFCFPDSWAFIPKKRNYYSTKFFKDYDYPDTTSIGCEEFIWDDKPFGIHFRGFRNNSVNKNKIDNLKTAINVFSIIDRVDRINS